jgi:hypothetical protein
MPLETKFPAAGIRGEFTSNGFIASPHQLPLLHPNRR